jgi:hypothetical protein
MRTSQEMARLYLCYFYYSCYKQIDEDTNLKRKLFYLMASEVSVHNPWLCWFWACGEVELHGGGSISRGYLPHGREKTESGLE